MAEYTYKANRQTPSLEAQAVGEELERIRLKCGDLTAPNVVKESRPKEAVLHEACDLHLPVKDRAELWSRHRARNIINVVQIIPQTPEGTAPQTEPVQAFVNVVDGSISEPDRRSYEPIQEVLDDPVKRARKVQQCLEKLLRVQREFRCLQELAVVWAAIDAESQRLASTGH